MMNTTYKHSEKICQQCGQPIREEIESLHTECERCVGKHEG
ncbi:YhfH family protein [Savagea serpentis]|nr:YhfH family protein [Savagea serpentis]